MGRIRVGAKKNNWKLLVILLISLVILLIPAIFLVNSLIGESKSTISDGDKDRALPDLPEAKELEVIDIRFFSGEEKLLFVTLQGIVNRKEPRLYVIENNFEEGNETWLKELDIPQTRVDSPWDVVEKYKDEIDGMIVYDPDVEDTINVATTLAGLKNGIVVSPDLVDQLKDAPYELPIIEDLRGQFTGRLDAYQWQFENLWNEVNHEIIVGLDPGRKMPVPPGNYDSFKIVLEETEEIRDSSNRDIYEIDLSEFLGEEAIYLRFQDAFPGDGWGPAVHQVTVKADGEVIAEFIPGTDEEKPYLYDSGGSSADHRFDGHRWADGGNFFIYEWIPPEGTEEFIVELDMWNQFKVSASNIKPVSSERKTPYGFLRDYAVAQKAMVVWFEPNVDEERALFEEILDAAEPNAPYMGWFPSDVAGEFTGTEIVSKHEAYVVPADWFNNLTVFAGVRANIEKQTFVEAPPLENKIYITFILGEGDNLQYNQHHMRVLWDDRRRGKVPINWSISPLLYDVAPSIFAYYEQTATENDLLIAGPSGAGYIYPNPWPDDTFDLFAKQTGEYMEKTGLDIIYMLNRIDGRDVPLAKSKAQSYKEHVALRGIFLHWANYTETTVLEDEIPQTIMLSASSVNQAKEEIEKATKDWDGQSPMFIAMGMLSWSMNPTSIEQVANSLGEEFVVVRGDQYFDLVRQAFDLPAFEPK